MGNRVRDASVALGTAAARLKGMGDPAQAFQTALQESWGVLEEDLPPDLWQKVQGLRRRMLCLPRRPEERESIARDLDLLALDVESLAAKPPDPTPSE